VDVLGLLVALGLLAAAGALLLAVDRARGVRLR
jgi:hypothetical protein